MNSGTREGLEWFGPPERNTLLHCVLDWCESLRAESLSLSSVYPGVSVLFFLLSLCNVACLPFYSSRGERTRVLSPDMWAQEYNGCNTWSCWSNLLAP
jgi:hypothetical protein